MKEKIEEYFGTNQLVFLGFEGTSYFSGYSLHDGIVCHKSIKNLISKCLNENIPSFPMDGKHSDELLDYFESSYKRDEILELVSNKFSKFRVIEYLQDSKLFKSYKEEPHLKDKFFELFEMNEYLDKNLKTEINYNIK